MISPPYKNKIELKFLVTLFSGNRREAKKGNVKFTIFLPTPICSVARIETEPRREEMRRSGEKWRAKKCEGAEKKGGRRNETNERSEGVE